MIGIQYIYLFKWLSMYKTLFFSLFFLLLFGIHFLFHRRVISRLLISSRGKNRASTFLIVNYSFNILYVVGRYTDIDVGPFYYLFSLSYGVTFVLFLYLLVHEVLELFHKSIRHLDPSRRRLFKKSGDGALMALSVSYLTAATYEGSKKPVIHFVDAGCCDFPFVQISDLHIGGLIDREFVKESVAKINALKPEIVFITGDLVDTSIHSIKDAILEFNHLEAPEGIYMVLGNHEYYHNLIEIIHFIRNESAITLLINRSVSIDRLRVNIVGVADLFGYRLDMMQPDIQKAYRKSNPDYQTILLAHQPKFIEELDGYEPDLILSGHTHGGQIWPFNYLVALQQPYVSGLHTLPYGGRIYVNSGIGFWGPPMRLGSQAEISYFGAGRRGSKSFQTLLGRRL